MLPTMRNFGVPALLLTGVLAACGGSSTASQPGPQATSGAPAGTTTTGAAGGGGAKGYDCPTLLTPAELDAASGLKGGTVVTNRRGDQASAGEVMGVTDCGISNDTVSTWFGHFVVAAGTDAMANFSAQWDIAKGQGASSVSGVGTEALLLSNDSGVTMWARGANGVGVSIGVAWDEETTTEAKVKSAEQAILTTVLSRS
jgi:hypothetical protein